MKMSNILFNVGCALFSLCIIFQVAQSKKLTDITVENCEVCVKFIQKFDDTIDDSTRNSPEKIENALMAACRKAKKDDNRFCYYIGGTDDSATSIINEVTKPLSYHLPAEKICKKLYKKDEQICDLKYDKELDLTNVDLKKLKVKDLKKILSDWEEQCRGCTEKNDFVARVEELLPQHAPQAAAARAKMEL